MLEQCPTCEGKVSSAAAACPHCGHPIGKPTDTERSERTVTTQESGKGVKTQLAIAAGVMIASPFLGLMWHEGAGWGLFAIGIIWWFIARTEQWWHYG